MPIYSFDDLKRETGNEVCIEVLTCRSWLRDHCKDEPAALRLRLESGEEFFALGDHELFRAIPQRLSRAVLMGRVDIVRGIPPRVITVRQISFPTAAEITCNRGLIAAESRLDDAERLIRNRYASAPAEQRPLLACLLSLQAALADNGAAGIVAELAGIRASVAAMEGSRGY